MIEVKKVSSGAIQVKSSVSDFCAAMGYCELRIKHFLRGIRPPQTQIMIEGIVSHEKEEAYEKEHFKFEPITAEELKDLKKDIEGKKVAKKSISNNIQKNTDLKKIQYQNTVDIKSEKNKIIQSQVKSGK